VTRGPRHSAKKAPHTTVTMEDVGEHLMSWHQSALVDLILEQAAEDDRLRDTLRMRVAARLADGPDLGTFRTALRDAFSVDIDEPWHGAWDWSHGAGRVIDSIEELLGQGRPQPVIDLCEKALELLDSASGMIDDSDGDLTSLAERIGELHLEACLAADIDQAELGRRLVDLELGAQQHEAFYGAIDRYEPVLGEAGLAAYRRAVEDLWAKVPPLGPGEDDPEQYGRRFRLTGMMERVVDQGGDVDQLVAVMAHDLSAGYDFLRIAAVLREAGRHEEALAWAERGLAAFADRPDPRLREFAADEHHRVGRHDAAMGLIWATFEERSCLDTYQRLREMQGPAAPTGPRGAIVRWASCEPTSHAGRVTGGGSGGRCRTIGPAWWRSSSGRTTSMPHGARRERAAAAPISGCASLTSVSATTLRTPCPSTRTACGGWWIRRATGRTRRPWRRCAGSAGSCRERSRPATSRPTSRRSAPSTGGSGTSWRSSTTPGGSRSAARHLFRRRRARRRAACPAVGRPRQVSTGPTPGSDAGLASVRPTALQRLHARVQLVGDVRQRDRCLTGLCLADALQ
jgi:hypothetical protein